MKECQRQSLKNLFAENFMAINRFTIPLYLRLYFLSNLIQTMEKLFRQRLVQTSFHIMSMKPNLLAFLRTATILSSISLPPHINDKRFSSSEYMSSSNWSVILEHSSSKQAIHGTTWSKITNQ